MGSDFSCGSRCLGDRKFDQLAFYSKNLMEKKMRLFILSLMMMGSIAINALYAEEISPAAAKHLEAAKSNEEQGAAFDSVIKEHEQKKKDYPKSWTLDPSLVPDPSEVEWVNRHCDEIIQGAQTMKKNVLEMAEWHRKKAVQPDEPVIRVPRASEMSLGVSDHSGWAETYADKAAELTPSITEHEKMKSESRLRYAPGLHQGERFAMKKYEEMEKHCDVIIRDAQRLQNDYLDFSKWHRMQESESEGRLAQ